ncbi:adenylosuccinate synthetase [Candidatus Woesearchaeota archaeon]|nr:adenylosuccinate synthetase [Candidatus Woesearchaeota archaeon]
MRSDVAFIGGQNGDEGKGKCVYTVTDHAIGRYHLLDVPSSRILAVRYQGAHNAGHTVIIDGVKYQLHHVTSSIITPEVYGLLGRGMYIEPRSLLEEIELLRSRGIKITPDNLGISSNAHVILDYHTAEDQGCYNLKEHTSTGRGIKQVARDKYFRTGMRFIEFLDKGLMMKILEEKAFPAGVPPGLRSFGEFADSYDNQRRGLEGFLADDDDVFFDPRFVFAVEEGAQGALIDIDVGQYPGITSSHPTNPPNRPKNIVVVYKFTVSSVGIGDRPFMTEMPDDLQDKVRQVWGEYGTSTGKPRHLGWFDCIAAEKTLRAIKGDYVAGTCLDRLEVFSELGVRPKVAVAYELDNRVYTRWDISFNKRGVLSQVKPIYKEFDPWDRTVEADHKTLTPPARKYVDFIEQFLGHRFFMIGTGPEDHQVIIDKSSMDKILNL